MIEPAMTIGQQLSAWARTRFGEVFPDADTASIALDVVPATDDGFGDYQCNAAMAAAKLLRKPPRDVAKALIEGARFPASIERAEIAGPGFINFHLNTAWLAEHLGTLQAAPNLGVPAVGGGRTVILDYSSPNIAKPMHIGHIRSTVIGNALDRLHRFLGYRVIADNHLGDWGTQFGIMILGYRNFCDQATLAADPIAELERVYVKSYEQAKADENWMNAARAELVKLQQGDSANRELWRKFVALSMAEFQKVYARLDVQFDLARGESFYNDALPAVFEALTRKALMEESDGAQVVRLDEEKLPLCIVRKSDGAANYATTDLATVRNRIDEFAPERIIYVTDERQQLHFKQFFAIARKLCWHAELVHVWFGLMRLPEGTFSTRQGNVIKLERLLDEAVSRALAIVKESSPDMPADQQQSVAEAVGIGAIKYADLSKDPQSLITFTWEKALAMNGNSAPYLQYACARIASVRDRYREQFPGRDPDTAPIRLDEPIERKLATRLARFGDVVIRCTHTYRPNALADYLYELAGLYSTFYQNVPFLKAPEGVRESRVRLCELTAATLRTGLNLLGIRTPERI